MPCFKVFIFLLLSLFLEVLASPSVPVLVISDIDDTLKVSSVLDSDSALANIPESRNVFLGMPQIFQALKQQHSQIQFKYLSNAPEALLKGFHFEFLKVNRFPAGELSLRELSVDETPHKVRKIRNYIQQAKPQLLVLLGDNGETDVKYYAQIQREYPHLKKYIFIRQAYSVMHPQRRGQVLASGQIGFATSFDLSLILHQKALISEDSVQSLYQSFAETLFHEHPLQARGHAMTFPKWMDCRDFKWPEYGMRDPTSLFRFAEVKNFVLQRCAKSPLGQ